MKSKVVHCRIEPYDVYIGRPSKWGNPFSHKEKGTKAKYKVATVEEAIKKYEEYILDTPELLKDIEELRDKVLGCWCKFKPDNPCHGDVLIKLLNKNHE